MRVPSSPDVVVVCVYACKSVRKVISLRIDRDSDC